MLSFIILFSFSFLNPFLALFILSLFAVYFPLPKFPFFITASISFAIFFYYRKYDVAWAESTDDVPTYILFYFSNKSLAFKDLFLRFFSMPGNNEPLWHLPFWFLINVFNASENTFIFIHYLLIFLLLIGTLITISPRYFVILLLGYFFLTPVSIDSVFHIWRQQLASTMFLLGSYIYLIKQKKRGLLLIYLSVFVHLVCLYFLGIFLFFNFLRRRNKLTKNINFFLYALLICFAYALLFKIALNFLASLNLDRVLMYAEDSSGSDIRLLIVLSIFMASVAFIHIRYGNDLFNMLIVFISFVTIVNSLLFPFASSIFGRLAYFTIPLIGIYFVRSALKNMSQKWMPLLVLLIFFSGLIRLVIIINNGRASAQFLAFEHPLDPFMGLLKMIFFL